MMAKENSKDKASLFALGCLPEDERKAFTEEMQQSSQLSDEVASFKPVVEALGFLADEEKPPAHLKARLGALIRHKKANARKQTPSVQTWKRWREADMNKNMEIVRAEDGQWEDTPIKGVRVKNLFVSRAENKVVMLVKMDAGCVYPPHVHAGPEECFVLDGDFYGRDFSMVKGDFQRAEPGSLHSEQTTKKGCLLLISSSLEDEIISSDQIEPALV